MSRALCTSRAPPVNALGVNTYTAASQNVGCVLRLLNLQESDTGIDVYANNS